MAIGSDIFAVNYNTIQDKAQSILGTGSATRGYGQPLNSSDVFTGNTITKAQWDALRFDIVNIRLHQDGILPTIVAVNVGDPIGFGAGSPNSNYDTLMETAIANRFNIGPGQSVATAITSASYSSPWGTQAIATLTVTFSTADEARYFFNSGSKIRITSTFSPSVSTAQNNSWANFLNSSGTRSFGADTDPLVNFYTLTDSFQVYYQGSSTTPYSANNYRLEARCDVPNNSSGTATIVYLQVTLNDSYIDPDSLTGNVQPPGDEVNGNLVISVEELKASGSLLPSGTFTITSPNYSISSISAS
jgi:hypothetical protein